MKSPIDPALAARLELATPNRYQLAVAPPPSEPWWERALEALRDFLARLFSHVHVGHGTALAVSWLVLAVAAGLLLALAVRIAIAIRPRRRSAAQSIEALSAQRDHGALAGDASAAAERGEMTLAVRLLFRAAIGLLGVRGAIDDDASSTIGELRAEVGQRGNALAAPFDDVASAYVAGVYAQRSVSQRDWERAHGAYEMLEAAARA